MDGFDRRGNHLSVEQINYFNSSDPGATTMRRPLCPMIRPKAKGTTVTLTLQNGEQTIIKNARVFFGGMEIA